MRTRGRTVLATVVLMLSAACVTLPAGSGGTGVLHTVEKGQTLWRIARVYGIDVQELAEINNVTDVTQIKAGDRLYIPGALRVREIPPAGAESADEPRVASIPHVRIEPGRLQWPLNGALFSPFGVRDGRRHDGIDISAAPGTPIRAADDGVVIYSDDRIRGYGNLIIIRHANRISTVYAHNRVNLVSKSERVKRGQVIGEVGMTGRTTGPHLHFEVRDGKRARNPLFFLPMLAGSDRTTRYAR